MSTKKALIVVDLQNDYFPGGKWQLHDIEAVAERAARVIAAARANGDLVVHVRHEFPTVEAPFFAPGSTGAETNAAVAVKGSEPVVVKHQINAFRDTDLKAILEENEIDDVTICGAMSHMCVDALTRAASDFGYGVTVVHDACASRDLEFAGQTIPAAQVHAAYMSALGFGYARLVSAAEYTAAGAARI